MLSGGFLEILVGGWGTPGHEESGSILSTSLCWEEKEMTTIKRGLLPSTTPFFLREGRRLVRASVVNGEGGGRRGE